MRKFHNFFSELWREIFDVTWTLYKLMIPIIIIIKIVEEMGGITVLSEWLSPLMSFVGLPSEMGLVWATTLLTNIYAGLLVFMNTNAELSVAQVSVLGSLMLIAHSLPIEAAVAKRAGVSVFATMVLRLGGGLLFAWILHQTYTWGGILEQSAQVIWAPDLTNEQSHLEWAWSQIESLFMIFVVISILLFTLKVLKILGIEKLIAIALRPVLKILGISPEATNMTIVGMTLGISFGGGLLINEANKGHIPARDIFTAIMLLNLVHSMIEDTILIMLIGADFISIFWGRLLFGLVVVALISHVLKRTSDRTCEKYLYKSLNG